MKSYRKKLFIPGLIVTLFASFDIIYQINQILNNRSFIMGPNILIAIIGLFLMSGSLKAVKKTTEILSYFLLPLGGIVLVEIFRFPIKLTLLSMSNNDIKFLYEFLPIGIFLFILWLFMTLRSEPILDAMEEKNIDSIVEWRKPLFLGVIFWCLIIGMSIWFYYGNHGKKIKIAVSNQYGIEYKSWIHGFRTGTGGTKAKVYIYNSHEYKKISVEYDDDSEVIISEDQ